MKAPKHAGLKAPPVRRMSSKPRIRMQKLRPVAASAFPTGPAAFPTDGAAPGPDAAVAGSPNGMPSGAGPSVSGE